MAVNKGDISGADEAFYGAAYYCGFSLREAAGTPAAAAVNIHDGTDNTGPLLEVIELEADGSAREFYDSGIAAENGIYIDVLSGTVEGSVRFR